MSIINNIDETSLVPIMMCCIMHGYLPILWRHFRQSTFITKLRVVCEEELGTDPIESIHFIHPPTDHPCGPIPTTGCFILTFIGKWNDIKKWNYSALQYTVSHIHDNKNNDQATIAALQEMGRHLNACFTHSIAQEMINTANGRLSSRENTITLGLVTNVSNITINKNKNDHYSDRITYIDPSNPSKQHTARTMNTTYINTSSIGWLCFLVIHSGSCYYHLPIVDLSSHTKFMKAYNPNDLPPAEAFAYNALVDKWKNEQCKKELSSYMPRPNELNPYTYLEAWYDNIKQFHVVQQKQKEQEEAKQQHQISIKNILVLLSFHLINVPN